MMFALKREDGAYYPVILLDGQEAFNDDACGGYESRGDAVKAVRDAYGQDMKQVSQSTLRDVQEVQG